MIVGADDDERRAVAHLAFHLRRLARKRLGVAAGAGDAGVHPRADAAGRFLRRADRGAEIHHRLGEIAGAALRHQRLGAGADFGFRRRQFGLDRIEPRDHPLDVAVDRHRPPAERDRRDRRRGVAADAGQRPQAILGVGKMSAVLRRHRLRAGVQVARAGVVAEPGPGLEHVVERRCGERFDIRPARQEFRVIRPDRLHGGLLQHDLGQPDVIGIGPLARRGTPRQMAAMPVVPGEQHGRIGRLVHTRRVALLPDRCACYPHDASFL